MALWLLRDGRHRERLFRASCAGVPCSRSWGLRPGGLRAFQHQLAYLFKVADADDRVAFRDLLDHPSEGVREAVMTIQQMPIKMGIATGLERGRVEEAANAVFRVLAKRGVPVSDDVRARVNACANLEELEGMLARALDVARAEDLFAS